MASRVFLSIDRNDNDDALYNLLVVEYMPTRFMQLLIVPTVRALIRLPTTPPTPPDILVPPNTAAIIRQIVS